MVSSDDNYLSMGGGVSAAIRRSGGEIIAKEAQKHVPASLGDVAVTSGGALSAKYVFHAITIDYSHMRFATEDSVQSATLRCLKLADTLGVKSLAFPALGTGVARFPFHLAAEVMTNSIADYLSAKTGIEVVTLALFAREAVSSQDLEVFYERAVALASASTQSKRLVILLNDLAEIVGKMGNASLNQRILELQRDVQQAQSILSETPEEIERLEEIQVQSKLGEISKNVVAASSEAHATSVWEDNKLEAEVLRTKLSGLFTQLNVQTSNLNRFEIEKAKHGGQLVPPRLETAIAETEQEIEKLNISIDEVRKDLAKIAGPKN
ncbi:macro domain-containing protein [Tateyamaria sp. SN3-11]|uniref:macro domain-containing protein n=1 Tax=Tateyamaria sp. SN3-11 TaxID=3092147 RepID=UPI0039EAF71D